MPSRESRHSASYDDNGDIVIPETEVNFVESGSAIKEEPVSFLEDDVWHGEDTETQTLEIATKVKQERGTARRAIIKIAAVTSETAGGAIRESIRQYKSTIVAAKPLLSEARGGLRGLLMRTVAGLSQPVWVRSGKKNIKQYSRGTLFVFDIVRFGGTFAGIFAILFAALNYQSFIEIASAKLEVFLEHPSLDDAGDIADSTLGALKASIVQGDARERGELFSYLPTVGPPDDRILIPKLHLNVPLVNPSVEALLRQDWVQVEADIQSALRDGVVHYPGTARPGQAGNFFVTGHSSYYPWDSGKFKTVFARLHELSVGDEYWVYFNGDKHRYVVRSKSEVQPSDTSVLNQPEDARISTLMTCTPVGTTLRRLIVRAEEVDPLTGQPLKVGERADTQVVPKVQLEALPI